MRTIRLKAALAALTGALLVVPLPAAGADTSGASAPATTAETVTGELLLAVTENGPGGGDPHTAEGHLHTAADRDHGQLLAAIGTADGVVPIEPEAVQDIAPGSTITATVTLAEDETTPAEVHDVDVLAVATAPRAAEATRRHTARVAVVTPRGTTPDPRLTTAAAVDLVRKGSQFWERQGTGITFDVVSTVAPYVSAHTCVDPWALWSEAAGKLGWTGSSSGDHVILILPQDAYLNGGCSYGIASIGNGAGSGGQLYVADISTAAMAHEIGHNLSLGHAQGFSDQVGEDIFGWQYVEYGDRYDVMGSSFADRYGPYTVGNLSARHQARIGLLPEEERTVLTSTSTVELRGLDRATGAGVRLATFEDPDTHVRYHLEYRPKVGNDNNAVWSTVPGVLVRVDVKARESILIDTTRGSGNTQDASIVAGRSWTTAGGGVSVEVLSADQVSARVRVRFGPPVVAITPKVTVQSSAPAYYGEGGITATVSDGATGTVTFFVERADGTRTPVGTAAVDRGQATAPWTPSPRATNRITKIGATYDPADERFTSVTSTTVVDVAPRDSRTQVHRSGSVVMVAAGGAAGHPPRGDVQLYVVDALTRRPAVMSVPLDADGRARADLSRLVPRGRYLVRVVYPGDSPVYGYATYTGSSTTLRREVVVGRGTPAPVVGRGVVLDAGPVRSSVASASGAHPTAGGVTATGPHREATPAGSERRSVSERALSAAGDTSAAPVIEAHVPGGAPEAGFARGAAGFRGEPGVCVQGETLPGVAVRHVAPRR